MKKLFELFLTFAKIGLFTFGGGYAMLPLIERTCVTQKQWINDGEMEQITLIAESTPGPIAINCATFIGYRQKKFPGALAATLGMVTPSFVIILLIAGFFERFMQIKWVAGAFQGIKLAVALLIIEAALHFFKKLPKKILPMTIAALSFGVMLTVNFLAIRFSSVVLLLAVALVSMAVNRIAQMKNGGKTP